MSKPITRADHSPSSLNGAALDFAIACGAELRHASRVTATIDAAHGLLHDHGLDDGHPLVLAALIAADLHQSGGPMDLGGPNGGTDRILCTLGKGRFQASDGSAYRAAGIQAVLQLCYQHATDAALDIRCLDASYASFMVLPGSDVLCFGIDSRGDDGGAYVPVPMQDTDLLDRCLCILRAGIHVLVPHGDYDPHVPYACRGDLADLGRAYNRLSAIRQQQTDATASLGTNALDGGGQ